MKSAFPLCAIAIYNPLKINFHDIFIIIEINLSRLCASAKFSLMKELHDKSEANVLTYRKTLGFPFRAKYKFKEFLQEKRRKLVLFSPTLYVKAALAGHQRFSYRC